MAREQYTPWPNLAETPNPRHQAIIDWANHICAEMKEQGYDLTLRQLYYQFVARGLIENTQRSYDNLGRIVNDARMAGLMDWDYLEDRTRNLQGHNHSPSVGYFVQEQRRRYWVDHWQDQRTRVEVWVEKEALVSVVARAALSLDLDYFACRGNVSMSELYGAAQRHRDYEAMGQDVIVLHLGDHDPSGVDMTRDNQDRLFTMGANTEVVRIALNMDQVRQYSPPPNPAKMTDARAKAYVRKYGPESWELDALTPQVINDLIVQSARPYLDDVDAFNARVEQQADERKVLEAVGRHWAEVREYVEGLS